MSIHCPKCHASRAHLEAREVHGRQEIRCLRCGFLDGRAVPRRGQSGRCHPLPPDQEARHDAA